MSETTHWPATACNRRTATRLLLGGSVVGLASGLASADTTTLALHSPFGKRVDYAFEATGDVTVLDHAPNLDVPDDAVSVDRGTAIEAGVATGAVNGGYDVFAYEGDLVGFAITAGHCADLELRDTGDPVDACELAARLPAPEGDGGREPEVLTACTTIDQPGTYALGADICGDGHGVCIEITADDVVLDGRDHIVDGGTTGGVGLRVTGDDVLVRDLSVIGWDTCVQVRGDHAVLRRIDFDNDSRPADAGALGLYVDGAASATVQAAEGVAADTAVLVESATDAILRDCSVTGLTLGIVLDGAEGSLLRNNRAGTAGAEGLVVNDAHDNQLVANEFGGFGIGVSVTASDRNVFRGNVFAGDDDHALAISDCEDLVLVDNDAGGGFSGVSLSNVTDSVLRGNVVSDTETTGIRLEGGSGNVLAQNATERNDEDGIEVVDTAENVIFGNTVRENGSVGIRLVDALENTVVRNAVCDNGGPDQIVVEGTASGNTISGNDTSCSP